MRTRTTTLAVAFALAACSGGSRTPDTAEKGPELARAAEPLPYQYLVVLRPGSESVAAVAGALLAGKDEAWPLRYYEQTLRGFALHASEETALAIASDPRVAWVAEDGRVRAQGLVTQNEAPAGLSRIDQRTGTDTDYQYFDGAGEGVHAYVLDTGILFSHVEFEARVSGGHDFAGDGSTTDCNGHGTHVAGILAGKTFGVAKKAKLHPVRVLGCDGTGATSDIIAGLEWLIANAETPAVANLSLGRDADAALDTAVEAVVAAGIPVVVAAGDRNRSACAMSPAQTPGALTVASTDLSGAAAAGFSNHGPCVDLFAPGVDVRSAAIAPSTGTPPTFVANVLQSGTSQSAPFVAGAVALYLGKNTTATPAGVARALFANSTRAPSTIDRYTPDRFLFTTFVDDDNSADTGAPTVTVNAPLAAAVVSGAAVAVTATASDDVGVTRVELFANGRFIASAAVSPYAFTWDTRRELNGTSSLIVRAYDKAGNATDSAAVTVEVQNLGIAHLDSALGVPKCETAAHQCDSVDALAGRAEMGPEENAPNTLQYSCPTASDADAVCRCADGPFGEYELDESIEQITVTRLGSGDLATGANVQVDVVVYVGSAYWDELDLFSSPTTVEPTWRYLGTLKAVATGLQTLSAKFTLPGGVSQAVRAALRYGGTPSTCTEGGFDDRDDLAFAVATGTPDTVAPTGVAITSPTAGSTVSGTITVAASATDDHLVSRVDFLVGSTFIGSAYAAPFSVAWNSGQVPNATYDFVATAWDGAGNSTKSAPVKIDVKDETPPTVSITYPAGGAVIASTPVVVKATATDNGFVQRVELWVNGAFYLTDMSYPYEFSWSAGKGTYSLVAKAYDQVGNHADSAAVSVSIGDAVLPTCAISWPVDVPTVVVGTVLLEATATDDKGVASVQFYRSGSTEALPGGPVTTAPWSLPWETGTLSNGTYTLHCVALDESGNASPAPPTGPSITLTVADVADPTVELISPPVTHDPVDSTDPTTIVPTPVSGVQLLEASAGDDGAVQKVEFYLDDTTLIGTASVPPYVNDWNSGTASNGAHWLTAKAYDYNSHTKVSAKRAIVTSDTTPPTVSIVFPLAGATLDGDVPIRATAADPGGALAKVELFDGIVLVGEMPLNTVTKRYELQWATVAASPGTHTLTVKATDVNSLVGTATVLVTVAPTGAVHDVGYGVPACLANVTTCHSSSLLDGRGPLGHEANAPNTLVDATLTPPAACADGPDGVYHADESIDFLSVRSVAGTTLTAGKATEIEVHAWIFDPALDKVELFYAADAAAPAWIRLPPPALALSAGKQVLKATYSLPNGLVQAVRASVRYAPGATEIGACLAGPYNDHDDLVFAVAAGTDGAPPTVAIVSPVAGASVGGLVEVTATASDDVAVASVELFVDGVLAETVFASPYAFSWDTVGLPSGTYTLTATATDYAGKSTDSAPVTVTVLDQLAPTVALTAPLPNEALMGTVTLAATADDAVGVTKVEFIVGGLTVATDTTSPFSANWNSASRADGVVSVTARAWDAAGNFTDSAAQTVLVSNFGNAKYDNTRKAPACATAASKCFSGTLVNGRGPLGPEPNAPNTLGAACADGIQGIFHVDESIDAIVVRSTGTLTAGGTATVEVKVWAGATWVMDSLDLYSTGDAAAGSVIWTKFATLKPTRAGAQVLSTSVTLPSGTLQAIRAQLRFAGDGTMVCGGGTFDDRDDLVFAVNP